MKKFDSVVVLNKFEKAVDKAIEDLIDAFEQGGEDVERIYIELENRWDLDLLVWVAEALSQRDNDRDDLDE